MLFSFFNALFEIFADANKLALDAQKRYPFVLEG
jgi:hypothetical protein